MVDPHHLLQTLASIHQHAAQVDAVVGGEAAAVATVNKDLAATCALLQKRLAGSQQADAGEGPAGKQGPLQLPSSFQATANQYKQLASDPPTSSSIQAAENTFLAALGNHYSWPSAPNGTTASAETPDHSTGASGSRVDVHCAGPAGRGPAAPLPPLRHGGSAANSVLQLHTFYQQAAYVGLVAAALSLLQADDADPSGSGSGSEQRSKLPTLQLSNLQPQQQLLSEVVAALQGYVAAGHAAAAHLHPQAPLAHYQQQSLATAAAPVSSDPWASASSSASPSSTAGGSSPVAEVVEEARRWRNRWLRGLLLCTPGQNVKQQQQQQQQQQLGQVSTGQDRQQQQQQLGAWLPGCPWWPRVAPDLLQPLVASSTGQAAAASTAAEAAVPAPPFRAAAGVVCTSLQQAQSLTQAQQQLQQLLWYMHLEASLAAPLLQGLASSAVGRSSSGVDQERTAAQYRLARAWLGGRKGAQAPPQHLVDM